jgi:hypothetical protein
MRHRGETDPSFYCDAMLGGLARWLRAAGFDAVYEYGIDDGVLIERAGKQGRIVLTSDGGIMERNVITCGEVPALFIPRQTSKFDQLEFVLRQLDLRPRQPRCMTCGGALRELSADEATGQVPPIAFERCATYWKCKRCGKAFWSGTHFHRIRRKLAEIEERL